MPQLSMPLLAIKLLGGRKGFLGDWLDISSQRPANRNVSVSLHALQNA